MTLENMLRDMSKKKNTYEYHINPIFSSTTNVSNIFPPKDPWGSCFQAWSAWHWRNSLKAKQNLWVQFPMICSFASTYTFLLWHFLVYKCQSYLSDMPVWTQKLQQTPTFYKEIQTYSDGRNSFATSNMFLRSCRLCNVKVFQIDASTFYNPLAVLKSNTDC